MGSARSAALVLLLSSALQPLLCGCARLPENGERTPSRAIADGHLTALGRFSSGVVGEHPGKSGVALLDNGLDAFAGRAVLARLAERSIDVQYYMFHQDTVGRLLIRELLAAADRGVRVRMLIDDMYGAEADGVWTALDAHPNLEVRLFNPFVRKRSRALQFLTRLRTVNHRMHSKSFIIDNQVAVVGGRNIGDEYFSADKDLAFADLDVLAVGPVVPDVSAQFDAYWNSARAYPATELAGPAPAAAVERLRGELEAHVRTETTTVYVEALEHSALAGALRDKRLAFSLTEATVLSDPPDKLDRKAGWRKQLLITQLAPHLSATRKELVIVSPYFIPGKQGTESLCELAAKGVRVVVLTNSLASNDVAAVHAGYARHRRRLLECGVQLFELNEQIKDRQGKRYTWLPGLSKSSLHAKALTIDRETMFVGSVNLDPRSLSINNEIGILFVEPELTARVTERFIDHLDEVAFRLELVRAADGGAALRWTGKESGRTVVFEAEPYAGFWKRLGVALLRLLPIDAML